MRLQIMSDLHIEHYTSKTWQGIMSDTQTDAETLVLAGDIVSLKRSNWDWSVARLQEFKARYKNVVYVVGNHEFYGLSIKDGENLLDELQSETGVHILRRGHPAIIAGQRFVGDTLFQPWDAAAGKISDHYYISDFYPEAKIHFKKFQSWLKKLPLTSNDIVVTHHAPSLSSVAPRYIGNSYNRWFITEEMEPLIKKFQPKLWVHGHTHTPFSYFKGTTRIVANPLGYPGEGVRFEPRLVIEV